MATEGHHNLSHHGNDATKKVKLARITRYHVQHFLDLAQRLKTIQESDGSLLDNTAVVFLTGISNANIHDHDDLPAIILGGKNLGISQGQHRNLNVPLANLLLSLIKKMGVQRNSHGNSNGIINL